MAGGGSAGPGEVNSEPNVIPMIDIMLVMLIKLLWENYQNNKTALGSGISAMPSRHMATATLMALFGWHHSRLAGIGLSLFALGILIGSIHLAWHYALDSYAGALGAWLVWGLVGRWQDRLREGKTAREAHV